MAEQTATADEQTQPAEEHEQKPAEDVDEQVREQAESEDAPAADTESPNADNDAQILRAGKLQALVAAYVPEGVDVEAELDYVGGLSVKDGKLVGEAKYRKPPLESQPAKQETKKAAPRQADANTADDWQKHSERIREYKRKHGMYNG